ncbi:MAG: hypothetical protein ACRDZ3_04275 [Acidimicrobiia bacterium]
MRPVHDAATALVGVGALEAAVAGRIEDELHRTLVARGVGDPKSLEAPSRWAAPPPWPPGVPVVLPPRLGYQCSADLRLSFGDVRLRYLVVTPDDGTGGGSMRLVGDLVLPERLPPPAVPGATGGRRQTMTGLLSALIVADDSGRRYELATAGGGGDGRTFNFTAVFRPAPSPTTTSLRFGPDAAGQLVSVAFGPSAPTTIGAVEEFPAVPVSERWLRARAEDALFEYLRGRTSDPDLNLEVCLDALVAVGSGGIGDPIVGEVRELLAVFAGRRLADHLPPAWKNALPGRDPHLDWDTTRVLAVILPPLGGVTVALEALEIRLGHGFLSLEMTPCERSWPPTRWPDHLKLRAVDDHGGRYIARPFSQCASPDHATAEYGFAPPLDPALRRLRLDISTATHSCTVDIDVDVPGP